MFRWKLHTCTKFSNKFYFFLSFLLFHVESSTRYYNNKNWRNKMWCIYLQYRIKAFSFLKSCPIFFPFNLISFLVLIQVVCQRNPKIRGNRQSTLLNYIYHPLVLGKLGYPALAKCLIHASRTTSATRTAIFQASPSRLG